MEKETKQYFKYIDGYLTIIINNFKSGSGQKITYNELSEMIVELDNMFKKVELVDVKKVGNICLKKYIPVIELLLKLDNNGEHAIKYEKALKNAYKMAARVSFEHYMMYREWDDKDKFFMPRYRIMIGYFHYLQELSTNPKFETVIANLPSGFGKEIADFEPVLTKNGWKKHGDLKVGDYVISPSGKFVKVYEIHPKIISNRKVTFEDGETIVCHARHEWLVFDRYVGKERIVETDYLMENLKEADGRNRFLIPCKEQFEGEYKELPVDPYTYGIWLGDGSTYQGRITENVEDMKTIIKYIKYKHSTINNGVSENVKSWNFPKMLLDLHKLGLGYKGTEKFIHDSYLTASKEQRLELLAGLIDSDGNLQKDKGNRYVFTTINEKLKDGVVTLANSFNWRTSVTKTEPKTSTSGIVGKHAIYQVGFSPDIKIPCKLKRKQTNKFARQRRIGITNVEIDNNKYQGNCISVVGGLYLVGKTLKITHNSYPEKINEAWAFGLDDTGTILSLCSNESVVLGGSRTVMDEMKSEAYGEVFPHLKYSKEDKEYFLKETAAEWKLRNCKMLASYYASTVKSNVVGSRASARIHIDDLYADYKEAQNAELNELYFNKYLTVWSKRFVQNKIPKVVVTGTLWSSGDFIAQLIEYYKKLYHFSPDPKYPYTIVNDEKTVAIIQVPALDYLTSESTCPDLKSTEEIMKDKNAMEDYLFQTNFQQIPTDPEALCFSWDKIRTYAQIPSGEEYSNLAVIDGTRKTGNDFFSMPIFKRHFNGEFFEYYMIDALFTQVATKDMIDDVCDKIIEHQIRVLVIETNVDGGLKKTILEKLKERGYYNIEIIEHYSTANKLARIEDQKGNIKRNLVFPNKNLFGIKSDIGQFMNNLTLFNSTGRNTHDDAPDSCALFTREIVEGGSKPAKAMPIKNPFA